MDDINVRAEAADEVRQLEELAGVQVLVASWDSMHSDRVAAQVPMGVRRYSRSDSSSCV